MSELKRTVLRIFTELFTSDETSMVTQFGWVLKATGVLCIQNRIAIMPLVESASWTIKSRAVRGESLRAIEAALEEWRALVNLEAGEHPVPEVRQEDSRLFIRAVFDQMENDRERPQGVKRKPRGDLTRPTKRPKLASILKHMGRVF